MASGGGPACGGGGPPQPAAPHDQRAVEQWLRFALAQEERVAPHPDPASLQDAGSRGAYRLALRHLDGLPLFATDDRCFDVRLGVSLWDRGAGCFFGNTARSAAVSYDMRRSKGKRGFHLNLDFHLYLHTRAALGRHGDGSSAGSSVGAGASGAAAAPTSGGGAGLAAVVEVVLVERGEDGVTVNEFSAGWAMVPLGGGGGCSSSFACTDVPPAAAGPGIVAPGSPSKPALGIATSSKPSRSARGGLRLGSCLGCAGPPSSPVPAGGPLSPLQSGALAARLGAGGSMGVPVFVGSPRWLVLHQASPPGTCEAPPQLMADGAECRLHFQFEPCPEAEAWAPLAPDNFLLSSRDVVPGVQRLGASAAGAVPAPTLAFLNVASQLEPPQLCDVRAVVLSGLRLHLPDGFVEVARQHAATVWRRAHAGGAAAGGASSAAAGAGRLLPLADLQQRLRMRVSVHNGRRFVGPPAVCQAAALEPVQGRRGEHELLLAQPAPMAWLPADRHVMLVLELLLHTEPPSGGRGAPGSPAVAPAQLEGAAGVTVLGWTAVSPFTWRRGNLDPAVAAGLHQASLRSGPGRWLRTTPVLDWRRMLERTNRLSPEAPAISFRLAEAPGQALWPPPAAPVPLHPALPVHQPVMGDVGRQAHLSTAPSEAETLVSVRAAPAVRQKQPASAAGPLDLEALVGGKPIAAPAFVQAWRISARYDAAGSSASEQQQQQQQQQGEKPERDSLPVLPSIRTRVLITSQAADGSDAAALYAGSPTKGRAASPGQLGRAAGAPLSVAAAAAAALPADETHAQRHVSLAVELDDSLASCEATLQFIAVEAHPGQGGGCSCGSGGGQPAQQLLPSRLHFTYRSLTGPAVTAPLRLQPAAGAGSPGPGGGHLFAFSAEDGCGAGDGALGAPEHHLQLLDVAGLLKLMSAEGLPPAAAANLARQHRLRATRWLAQGRLQVDLWDSASLLQVGTVSLPLHGLLRQGQPSTELLLRVPVADPNRAISRHDASGSAPRLCCSPIRGSLIVRLACTGTRLDLPAPCPSQLTTGSCSWPSSPVKQLGAGDGAVVVRAKPALEEGGQLALELARLEGVPEDTAPDRLAEEVVGRAAAKVQRLLHYRSLPGAARQRSSSSTGAGLGGGASSSGAGSVAAGAAAGCSAVGGSEAGLLLERRLLTEVEAARERCKRQAILARLQAELPSCQALCIAPGETGAFEFEFASSSSSPAWFEVDLGSGGSSCTRGSSAVAATLSFVSGEHEWRALEETARLAGLCHSDSRSPASGQPRAVYSSRFQLAAHERCLLRLKLSSGWGDGQAAESEGSQGSLLSWREVAIRPAGSGAAAGAFEAVPAAAVVRVGVQQLAAPAVDRKLRIYCPASSSVPGSVPGREAAAAHAVDLEQLPGANRLLASGQPLAFVSSSPAVRATLEGRRLALSCPAAEPGSTQRFFVAAHSPTQRGSSSSSSSSSSSATAVGCPSQVWEVFVHTLPTVRLAASLGTVATASCLVAQQVAGSNAGAGTHQSQGLSFSWRGCSAAELAASMGSGPSTAASAGGRPSRLVLSYEPAAVGRRELLLSVVASGGSQLSVACSGGGENPGTAPLQEGGQLAAGRPRQVELLLVQLDSSGTRFSRTFEVEAPPAGQALSKKVRYSSPYPQPRRFAVRSLHPAVLRLAPKWQRAVGGVLLQPGEEAAIRLAFEGCAAAGHGGSSHDEGQQCEAVAVLESTAVAGSDPWQVEEVFRVLLKAA